MRLFRRSAAALALGIATLGGAGALAAALPIGTGVASAASCPNVTPVGGTGLTAALVGHGRPDHLHSRQRHGV